MGKHQVARAVHILTLCAFGVTGCGPAAERGEVEGVVRRHGQPLAEVLVTFLPDGAEGPRAGRAAGVTDAHGRFRLKGEDQRDGAVAGAYRVIVEDLAVYRAPRSADGTVLRTPPVRFPATYRAPLKTPLREQVRAGTQSVELDLADRP